jgi:hypothetical protein
MKFGFSSYSFHQRISTGDMSLFDVIDWVADSQGEHLELAVLSNSAQNTIPTVESDPDYVASRCPTWPSVPCWPTTTQARSPPR